MEEEVRKQEWDGTIVNLTESVLIALRSAERVIENIFPHRKASNLKLWLSRPHKEKSSFFTRIAKAEAEVVVDVGKKAKVVVLMKLYRWDDSFRWHLADACFGEKNFVRINRKHPQRFFFSGNIVHLEPLKPQEEARLDFSPIR